MSDDDASRHQSRERALSLLYEATLKGIQTNELVGTLILVPSPFVVTLLDGEREAKNRAEELISNAAVGWPLNRMATVDLLIMRLAAGELADQNGAPVPVVLDEAVELAKVYSTEKSGRFINGILARIAGQLRDGWLGGDQSTEKLVFEDDKSELPDGAEEDLGVQGSELVESVEDELPEHLFDLFERKVDET